MCGNMTEPLTLKVNGTGVFSLEHFCQANTVDDGTKLIPERKVSLKTFKNYVPQLFVNASFETGLSLTDEDFNSTFFPKTVLK